MRLKVTLRIPAVAATALLLTAGISTPADAAAPLTPLALAAVGQGGTGTIKGRLVYGGAQAPTPKVLVAKGDANVKDAAVCAKDGVLSKELAVDPSTKGIQYGFAYLVNPKGDNPQALKDLLAKSPVVEVDQEGCEFKPHCVAVHAQQKIKFLTSDPVAHNVHLAGFNNALNQMVAPGQKLEIAMTVERRPVSLKCDLHPWMSGYILVLDHPYFAVTGEDGSFEITGVPAGTQNLIVWQEKAGYITQGGSRGLAVKVAAGQTVDIGDVVLDPAKVK